MKTDVAAHAAENLDLIIRPYAGETDHAVIARIQNEEWAADGVRSRMSVPEIHAWLRHPSEQFDPARDLRLVEMGGAAVAVTWSDWVDATDGVRDYRSRGYVVPAFRRRGIGGILLADNIRRMRELAATHATDRPKVLGMGTNERGYAGPLLAERHGFAPVRWFFDMERPITGDLPVIGELAAGLEIRPVGPDEAWAIWEAGHEAFADHWGGHDPSEASFRRWVESPEFDPPLFIVAFDGDEIAGAVLNAILAEENAELGIGRGWLDSVFTRRAWRRRGLARDLIARSLHLLRERGMETAALGVDADNPSGALGMYEEAGFRVTERFTAWRRTMEEA